MLSKNDIIDNRIQLTRQYYVYFLISGEEIVYVGKCEYGLRRIADHLCEGRIKFNAYYYVESTEEEYSGLEKNYIRMFQPKYNTQYTKHTLRSDGKLEKSNTGKKRFTFKHKNKHKRRLHMQNEAKAWNKGF